MFTPKAPREVWLCVDPYDTMHIAQATKAEAEQKEEHEYVAGPYVLISEDLTDEARLPRDPDSGLPIRIERADALRLMAEARADERSKFK
jgi:hypothetical protein